MILLELFRLTFVCLLFEFPLGISSPLDSQTSTVISLFSVVVKNKFSLLYGSYSLSLIPVFSFPSLVSSISYRLPT